MKNPAYLLLIALLFLSCSKTGEGDLSMEEQQVSCIPNELIPVLIAYYPFSNGSLEDFSDFDHHLTNPTTATPTFDRELNENCAFEFNFLSGNDEFLTTTVLDEYDLLTNFSVTLWYQPLQVRKPSDFESLFRRGEQFENLEIGLFDCRKPVFSWTTSVWGNNFEDDCTTMIANHEWRYLAVTFNSLNNEMKLYVNAILENESDIVHNFDVNHIGDLFIGRNFTGKIDDIYVFKKTLTVIDIENLFNINSCCN